MTNYSSIRYASSGTTVYADMNALIAATGSDGAQAFVQSNNNIYVYAGTGWYKIATVQNDSPSAITGVNGSYSLAIDGAPTVITAVSTDPEGFPLTWTYSTSGLGSIATVSQVDNVFTVTPSTNSADVGTFTLTINATDGVNGAVSANTSITLQFQILNSNYTTLLATAVDTSDNNNVTDSSGNNNTITVNGGGHAGTFSPYRHGGYSAYFDGESDYLDFPASSTHNIGTGDFTLESWFNTTSSANDTQFRRMIMLDGPTGNVNGNIQLIISSDGYVNAWTNSGDVDLRSSTGFNDGLWHHAAIVRSGSTLTLYVDGASVSSMTYTTSISFNSGSPRPRIGSYNGTGGDWLGYLRDVRLVVGTAVYTSAFTPPSEPLEAIANTSLLACHLPYIADGSSNGHEITIGGNVSTKPLSPYENLEYAAADHGGSVSIPNDNDYLYVPHSSTLKPSGTDPFCVSFWYYPTSSPGTTRQLVGDAAYVSYPTNCPGWDILYSSSGELDIRWGYPNYADLGSGKTNSTVQVNAWNHIVFCRSGGSLSYYLNGKRCNTTTSNINISASGAANFYVGYAGEATGTAMTSAMGTIADFKYEVGTSQFDATSSTITVPTAPQSTTNSVLHISGTDASIIDKSQTNDLKLFGNTTGSTTEVKFVGSKSMYFDGSGDYIKTSASTNYDLPTDFTIEAWIYPTSLSSNRLIVDTYNASQAGSYQLYWRSTGGSLAFYTQADGVVLQDSSGSNIQVNTWHHVAVTRSGSTFRMFVDGTQVNSTTLTRDLTHGIPVAIGYQQATNTNYFAGYMQDVRITKGLARYTANFTPPTEPLKG